MEAVAPVFTDSFTSSGIYGLKPYGFMILQNNLYLKYYENTIYLREIVQSECILHWILELDISCL